MKNQVKALAGKISFSSSFSFFFVKLISLGAIKMFECMSLCVCVCVCVCYSSINEKLE